MQFRTELGSAHRHIHLPGLQHRKTFHTEKCARYREILFDPLGLVAPISIQGKFHLRELTQDTTDWDEPLPADKEEEWITWRDSLQALEHFQTSRCYTSTSISNAERVELHVFADASVKAIVAVAYLKVLDSNGMDHVGFVIGRLN